LIALRRFAINSEKIKVRKTCFVEKITERREIVGLGQNQLDCSGFEKFR